MEDSDHAAGDIVFSCWRGSIDSNVDMYFQGLMNKDFAIGYDRMICLVDGWYEIYIQTWANSSSTTGISVNGTNISLAAQTVVSLGEQYLTAKMNTE